MNNLSARYSGHQKPNILITIGCLRYKLPKQQIWDTFRPIQMASELRGYPYDPKFKKGPLFRSHLVIAYLC